MVGWLVGWLYLRPLAFFPLVSFFLFICVRLWVAQLNRLAFVLILIFLLLVLTLTSLMFFNNVLAVAYNVLGFGCDNV